MIDGLNVAASFNGGGVSTFIYDVANTRGDAGSGVGRAGRGRERRAAGEPHSEVGRQHVQRVWRSTATRASGPPATTSTTTLRSYGLTEPAGVITCLGHQRLGWRADQARQAVVLRQRRNYSTLNPAPGHFPPTSMPGDATKWTCGEGSCSECGTAIPGRSTRSGSRSQVTPRNRVSFSQEHQHRCSGSTLTRAATAAASRESD